MKYKEIIKLIIEILVIAAISYLVNLIPFVYNTFNIFIPKVSNVLYIFIGLITVYMLFKNVIKYQKMTFIISVISYIILIILTLYIRPKYEKYMYKDGIYLLEWFKNIFKNKIIFINIIGNLGLFIPMGIIIGIKKISKTSIDILLGILLIICLELVQFFTKRGVFDLGDIVLNSIGFVFGVLIYIVRKEVFHEREKRKRN